MLQKYDLERDNSQRKDMAAVWGVELKDSTSQTRASANGRKQTMTQQDIMQNYGK